MILAPRHRAAARLLLVLVLAALVAAAGFSVHAGRMGAAPVVDESRDRIGTAAFEDGPSSVSAFQGEGRAFRLPGRYAARIVRVIDGDTVEARIAVWLGQEVNARVRLRGIDAPEANGACGPERALALAAHNRLRDLAEGRIATLAEVGGDKYFGRVVADLHVGPVNAGDALLAEGLARPYRGGRRESWCAHSRP